VNDIRSAIFDAFGLLLSGDHQLWSIVFTSLSVSLRALALATPLALLIAFALAYLRFPGQRLLVTLFNTAMAVPAVVVGLVLYMLLSTHGPAGELRLLFTPGAMIIGQFLLCLPLMVALAHASFRAGDQRAWESALTLGAHPWRALFTVVHELRFGLLAAVLAGFGRIIAEVGCSMMVGGNILYHTRNITTAIALETSKGAFASGVALGLVLLLLALGLNLILAWLQGNTQVAT
jgi:tungstate transport system permease protein